MLMHKSTFKQSKKINIKIFFPYSTILKTNIVLNVKNKKIKGLRTSLMSEASFLVKL